MNMIDFIIIAILVIIVGLAVYSIYKSKKCGRKCMGCPGSATFLILNSLPM